MKYSGDEALKALGTCPKNWRDPPSTRYTDCICPRVKQLEQLMAFDISDECGQLACDMDEEEEEEQL